jgi:cytidylate kinase
MADEQGQDIKAEPGQEDAGEGDNEVSFEDVVTGLANELANAYSPGVLQVVFERRQSLLGEEMVIEGLSALTRSLLQDDEDSRKMLGKILLFRLDQIRLLQERNVSISPATTEAVEDMSSPAAVMEVRASKKGMAVGSAQGDITQNNTEYNIVQNAPLEQEWQRPARVGLKKNFVGREGELKDLRKRLLDGQSVVISGQASPTVTVQGMPGIGKTFLAERLAQELNERFSAGVIWQTVGPQRQTKEQASEVLNELAKYAFKNQRPVGTLDSEQVRAWLEHAIEERALLVVLDDVWSIEVLRVLDEAIPARAVRMVTTRKEQVARYLSGHHCQLDRLSSEDGLKLLEDRLQLGESDATTYRE